MAGRRVLGVAGGCLAAMALVGAWAVKESARAPTPASPASPSTRASLAVDLAGCAAIVRGPVCETRAGAELKMWVPGREDGELVVAVNGREVSATTTAWPDGRTLHATVPPGAARLEVRRRDGARWEMPLAPPTPTPPVVEKARALRAAGKLDEAAAMLDVGGSNADVVALAARVAYARGRIDEAAQSYRAAIAAHAAAGRLSQAADDSFAFVFLLLERRRYGEVRPLLTQAVELARDWPEGRVNAVHNEGLLAAETGDLRLALQREREAERQAERLDWAPMRRAAAEMVGLRLVDLGRPREALDALRALLTSDGDQMSACDRGDLLDNVGWAAELLEGAGERTDTDPRGPLRSALGVFHDACPDPNRTANALVNLALAERQRGEIAGARRALDEARTTSARAPRLAVALFWHHEAGRIELTSGSPRSAAVEFQREVDLAAAGGNGEDRRLAASDLADALVASGKKRDALAALELADSLLDASGALIPLGEGKQTFFGTRDHSSALRVWLLVQLGRVDDALAAARRARARMLAGLRGAAALERLSGAARGRWEEAIQEYRRVRGGIDAEAAHDWELPSDRLAEVLAQRRDSASAASAALDAALRVLALPTGEADPPAHALRPGELELLYFPAPSGWLAFAREESGTQVAALPEIDRAAPPAALAAALLSPWDDAIARATRMRILAYGAVRSIDVHALPWRGRPLVDHVPISYALDVGDPRSTDSRDLRALVVADPTGDLPSARTEADAVVGALTRGGWSVGTLRGDDARSDAVRAALGGVTLLHYAGHAEYGGVDGTDSALPLAAGGALNPGDVLSLGRGPRFVSLFGCETGRESVTGAADALGLASAFLLAGSSEVIATSRVVDDSLAREVATELYDRLGAGRDLDLPAALQGALVAVRERRGRGAEGWPAFRLLVR